ncbi:MAG TPA: SMC-Scp complex subunit ScpB [Thermomicrobiales bacterium]|nr:SMC-Scp complex subunit ScpB [Thermomicrobiales bacterium]
MTDVQPQSSAQGDESSRQEEEQLRLPSGAMPSSMTDEELAALVEALLLVAHDPPTIEELAAGAEVPADEIERALSWLDQREDRGWVIQRHGRRIHLATAPRFAAKVRTFLGLDRESRLSSASLEALAIVAYEQPVTRTEIDRVRGVDSSGVLAKLHARGLIEPVGRLATVGNPIQYGTTADFLKHFGLRSLDDLPPLGEIDGKDGRALLDAARASDDEEIGEATTESEEPA